MNDPAVGLCQSNCTGLRATSRLGEGMARPRTPKTPFYRFNSSPEIIRLVVMMYVKFPLSLRNVEDLLHERGIDICHETVRMWWNRFGPMFAAEIRQRRVQAMRQHTHWKWHLDEVYVKINGEPAEIRGRSSLELSDGQWRENDFILFS
jgi:hypothetical protein